MVGLPRAASHEALTLASVSDEQRDPPYVIRTVVGLFVTVVGGVLIYVLTQGLGDDGADTATEAVTEPSVVNSATDAQTTQERVVFTGPQSARDGEGFRWVVRSVSCEVEPPTLWEDEPPQGEYCRVDVTVTNRTNAAANPLFAHYAWSGDRAYEDFATDGAAFDRDIFPDSTAEGAIFFDVPARASIDVLQLNALGPDASGTVFELAAD